MKKKIGTILDEKLLLKAKQEAVFQKQSLSHLFEAALEAYLYAKKKESTITEKNIVHSTHGVFKISPKLLNNIMLEEEFYET